MLNQIEITTYCNSNCFYCPNGNIDKRHMDVGLYKSIIDSIVKPSIILLQGTGEPLMNPYLDKMVQYAKYEGHFIKIITNGSFKFSNESLNLLDEIGFSLDTLSKKQAKKSGRTDIAKTIENLLICKKRYPKNPKVYAVYYGQDTKPLENFCKDYKIPLIVQNLQTKNSYQYNYNIEFQPHLRFKCNYIDRPIMQYYFVDGTVAPCPYMIYKENCLPVNEIRNYFLQKKVPICCLSCEELTLKKRVRKTN